MQKLKLPVDLSGSAELTTSKAVIASKVDQIKCANSKAVSYVAKREELEDEVSRRRRELDPLDSRAVEDLQRKERQLQIIEERLTAMIGREGDEDFAGQQGDVDKLRKTLRGFMRRASPEIQKALRPGYEVLLQVATEALAPLFLDRGRAVQIARETEVVRAYGHYMNHEFGGMVAAEAEAMLVLPLIEAILAGENPFRGGFAVIGSEE